ncbi:SRPBCC domain-containing protein [Cellulomonas sp. Root137]|uniref:SRPBCC family protein n=1 Tax=Cellulomonas sp. Root137 TaxID=1736459 RepID=UPI000700CE7C|nr:SRPBCC domain-containing protein [Cellulomonas sp. Root137]KQY46521.1 hypothetical protein ASD18_03545 [Cellulomonas sp. Root137]
MSENHVARASVDIPAPAENVWDTLVDPEATWMMGARVTSAYVVGVPITFDGEWDGRPFQDHGEILEVDRPRRLRYTHYSPLSGQPDVPENYHHLTFTFDEDEGSTAVTLEQDGNGSAEEAAHSTANWEQVLGALRDAVVADAERAGSS